MLYSSTLNFKEIKSKIKTNLLPIRYNIQTPCDINVAELIHTLSLFTDNQKMLALINEISGSAGICINVNHCRIRMGLMLRFIEAYAKYDLFPSLLPKDKQNLIFDHFKKNIIFKEQITYLLKKIGNLKHRYLFEHCFDKDLLLAFANDYSCVSTPSDYIGLYNYFNPQHLFPSPTPLLDIYYLAERTGHVLGLSNNIIFQVQNRKYNIKQDGGYSETSLNWLIESLDAYRLNFPNNIINSIHNAFKTCHALIQPAPNSYKLGSEDKLFGQYQNGKLTYLSCKWPGHCVGLAFLGNYLIFCNRGIYSDRYFGCKIYRIKDLKKIDIALFKKLTKIFASAQAFNNTLNELVNLKKPVLKFRSKGQNHPTCSYVNPKAIIEGMLVLAQAGSNATKNVLREIFEKEYTRRKYKHLTTFIRDREIDELLKKMSLATHPDLIHFFAALTANIIKEHHGKDRGYIKDRHEIERAVTLFTHLPKHVKNILEKDLNFMQIIRQVNTKYQTLYTQPIYLPYYKKQKTAQNIALAQRNMQQLLPKTVKKICI